MTSLKFRMESTIFDLSFQQFMNLFVAFSRRNIESIMNIIRRYINVFLAITTIWIDRAFADYSYVISTPIGSHRFFMMLPENDNEKPSGRCYEVDNEGRMKINWEVRGWYSLPVHVYLASDGVGLVRIKQIKMRYKSVENQGPLGNEVFLEFFKEGKLIKEIYLKDIVNPDDLRADNSRFNYDVTDFSNTMDNPRIVSCQSDVVPREKGEDLRLVLGPREQMFVIKTMQGEKLFFAMSSGKEIYRFKPKGL